MNESVALSYVLTTFNKVEYLRVTLPLLVAACQSDEEIVIVDGGSTDGTKEYLGRLKEEGKIHQFISEKDFGESHGTNKAMLMARGELIKIITDDDVYHYPAIGRCRAFMLNHPKVDVLGFDGFGFSRALPKSTFLPSQYINGYRDWVSTKKPFLFCGLSLMIRRKSLAYMGLFNPLFKIIDMEYSMRVSSLKAGIAYYTGLGFVNIVGPDSNSVKFYEAIEQERDRVNKIYLPKGNAFTFSKSIKSLRGKLGGIKETLIGKQLAHEVPSYVDTVEKSLWILAEHDASHPHEILTAE